MKPIVAAQGLEWNKQLELIKRDAVLSQGMTTLDIPLAGDIQNIICLRRMVGCSKSRSEPLQVSNRGFAKILPSHGQGIKKCKKIQKTVNDFDFSAYVLLWKLRNSKGRNHEQHHPSHPRTVGCLPRKNEHMLSNLPPIFRMRLVLRRSWRENAIRTSGGCRLLMNGCAFRRIVDALGRFKKAIGLRLEKTERSSSQPHSAKKFEKMSKKTAHNQKIGKENIMGQQESETQNLENIMTAFITVPADVHHACTRKL